MPSLQGKVAIVTGGSGGFGEGIVKKLLEDGAKVVMIDLKDSPFNTSNVVFIRGDVSDIKVWENALNTAINTFGHLDIVVNNAAILFPKKETHLHDLDNFDKIVKINVKSIFISVNVVIPYFLKRGKGNVINIASTASVRARAGNAYYTATKGAVRMLTKSLAIEYGKKNIRFNAVAPTLAATGMFEDVTATKITSDVFEKFRNTFALDRFCTPRDIGNMCSYLASDDADFITGAYYLVDGGRSLI